MSYWGGGGSEKHWHSLLVHGEFQLCRQTINKTHVTPSFTLGLSHCHIRLINSHPMDARQERQHCYASVLPTKLPLNGFYMKYVKKNKTNQNKTKKPIYFCVEVKQKRMANSKQSGTCRRGPQVFSGCIVWVIHHAVLPHRSCRWIKKKKRFPVWPLLLFSFCPFSPSKLVQLHDT